MILIYFLLAFIVLISLWGLAIVIAFAVFLVRWKNGTWDGLHR